MARLDPTNDYAFKKIFATEQNKKVMISFLNDILEAPDRLPIQNIHYLNPQHDPAFAGSKPSCVDVMCIDTAGPKYVVEMQVSNHDGFTSRCQYYAAKTYSQQALKGADYTTLKEVM